MSMTGNLVFHPKKVIFEQNDFTDGTFILSFVLDGQEFRSEPSIRDPNNIATWTGTVTIDLANIDLQTELSIQLVDMHKTSEMEFIASTNLKLNEILDLQKGEGPYTLQHNGRAIAKLFLSRSFRSGAADIPQGNVKGSVESITGTLFGSKTWTEGFAQRKTYVEQHESIENRTFTKDAPTYKIVEVEKEVEHMRAKTYTKTVDVTRLVEVQREFQTMEPKIVEKMIEVVESRVVPITINVVQSFRVKKPVKVVEMVHTAHKRPVWELQTFQEEVEVVEQVPEATREKVHEVYLDSKLMEYVQPVITIQKTTKEILEAAVIKHEVLTDYGPITLALSHQNPTLHEEEELILQTEKISRLSIVGSPKGGVGSKEDFGARGSVNLSNNENLTSSVQKTLGDSTASKDSINTRSTASSNNRSLSGISKGPKGSGSAGQKSDENRLDAEKPTRDVAPLPRPHK